MDEFWISFWSSLASTILGLLIGVPVALWMDRLILSRSQKQEQEQERERLVLALETLSYALSFNLEALGQLLETLAKNRVPFNPAVDCSAWDAVKSEIVQRLRDPVLQRKIAYHFAQTATMVKLNEMYLDYAAGLSAAIGGSENTRDSLKNYLVQGLVDLREEAKQLVRDIAAAKQQAQS